MISIDLPTPNNEAERLKALHEYDILDTEYDEQFDRLVQLASQICETPIGLISLIDSDRQWFKSKIGIKASETPRKVSFCQFAIMDQDLFMVENASIDERFKENPLVTGDPNIKFYAGQPLIDENGFALGTLCVIDKQPKTLSKSQQDALKILAAQITHTIQLKKAQKEKEVFHRFFKLSLNGMCIANGEGKFLKVNPALCDILGYSENELNETSFFDFIHLEDQERSQKVLLELDRGQELKDFRNRFIKKTGETVELVWNAQIDRNTGEIFAVANDVTALNNTIHELKVSNQNLDKFAYIISHDLKAPLRSINTLAKFLEEDLNIDDQHESSLHFQHLKSSVNHIEQLIDGVYNYVKASKSQISKSDLKPNQIIETLINELFSENLNKIEVQENIPVINYNKTQFKQVFQNLIDNAVKYTDKEERKIQIGYDFDRLKNAHLFSVSDNGPGISKNFQKRIFDIFVSYNENPEIDSSGVGLSIVHKIVNDNKGEIWVESDGKSGSSFKFTIPV